MANIHDMKRKDTVLENQLHKKLSRERYNTTDSDKREPASCWKKAGRRTLHVNKCWLIDYQQDNIGQLHG
jgi:hypothetical protein